MPSYGIDHDAYREALANEVAEAKSSGDKDRAKAAQAELDRVADEQPDPEPEPVAGGPAPLDAPAAEPVADPEPEATPEAQ